MHSSCIGNTLRLGTDPDFTGIDTSLAPNGHALPLWLLTILFTYIIGVTYRVLGLEYEHHDKALSEFAGLFCNKGL